MVCVEAAKSKKEVKILRINIYKDKLLDARLFGAPVLYSAHPIPREDAPDRKSTRLNSSH